MFLFITRQFLSSYGIIKFPDPGRLEISTTADRRAMLSQPHSRGIKLFIQAAGRTPGSTHAAPRSPSPVVSRASEQLSGGCGGCSHSVQAPADLAEWLEGWGGLAPQTGTHPEAQPAGPSKGLAQPMHHAAKAGATMVPSSNLLILESANTSWCLHTHRWES